MSFRLHYIVILVIFVIIPKTTVCTRTGGVVKKLRNAVGLTPSINENNIDNLQHFTLFEADLIKVAAYKKLIKLYKEYPEKRSSLVTAIIIAATELVNYYAAISNYPKEKYTLIEGRHYTKKCLELLKEEEGLCYKLKTRLYAAHFFSHKLHGNRIWRKYLTKSFIKAKDLLKDDREISFLETKLLCEIKLSIQNKSEFSKAIKSFFMGSTKNEHNINCVEALLRFKDEISNVGSNVGEYYYLLGRAYAKNGENKKAMQSLQHARKDIIVDTKKRNINKAVQELMEKLYFRVEK